MAKAKTINMLLNDGTLNGVISMENSSWHKGELYSAPRASVDDLISTDACARYGVYLLLSEDMVYIGQSSDLSKRIKQHIIGKTWWERVVILTTSDDSLNRGDLDYIEAYLIALASKAGRLDCDNKNTGNKANLKKFREVEMQQYLEEALFLLELIGINVFRASPKSGKPKNGSGLIPSVVNTTDSERAIREKKDAIQFLKSNGISLLKNINYASRQEKKEEFWINPQLTAIDDDWDLVLNDPFKCQLIYMRIPAKSLSLKTKDLPGLALRRKPERIDLSISSQTFIDTRSGTDFSPYIVRVIQY